MPKNADYIKEKMTEKMTIINDEDKMMRRKKQKKMICLIFIIICNHTILVSETQNIYK